MGLSNALRILETYREKHLQLATKVIEADNGNIFPVDLLIISSLNRSMCLLRGFLDLIKSRNFICAAPLVRIQLDNGLRLFAGTLVNDPHQFTMKILEGIPVKNQEDNTGNKMKDFYLVEKLSGLYPWVKEVYDHASGYVHLSEKHFWNAINLIDTETGKFSMKITDEDEFVSEQHYEQAVISFRKATDIVFNLVDGWIFSKNNPGKRRSIS